MTNNAKTSDAETSQIDHMADDILALSAALRNVTFALIEASPLDSIQQDVVDEAAALLLEYGVQIK